MGAMPPPCWRFFIFSLVLLLLNVCFTLISAPPVCSPATTRGGVRRVGYTRAGGTPAPPSTAAVDAELFTAALHGDAARISSLLSAGARVLSHNNMNASPLLAAAAGGHAAAARALLAAGADVNAADVFGATPLIAAAREGHLPVVKLLLGAGAEVLGPVVVADGGGALLRAVRRGHLDVALALVTAGATVNGRDKQGRTPIMYAVQDNRKDMVAMLLEARADVGAVSPDRVSALSWARTYKRGDIEELLVKAGAK